MGIQNPDINFTKGRKLKIPASTSVHLPDFADACANTFKPLVGSAHIFWGLKLKTVCVAYGNFGKAVILLL